VAADFLRAGDTRVDIHGLDKLHRERVADVAKRARDNDGVTIRDIFISERVLETLAHDKLILSSFRIPQLLTLLPFIPNVYVLTCPSCIDNQNLDTFRQLTRAGFIIPIFTGPYAEYPAVVTEAVVGLDHMNCYEYDYYRYSMLAAQATEHICRTCQDQRRKKIVKVANQISRSGITRRDINLIFFNLTPAFGAAEELVDALERVVRDGKPEDLRQLKDISYAVFYARTAVAFKGAQLLSDSISDIPAEIDLRLGTARELAVHMTEMMADGLKLKVPNNIAMEPYIELLQNYRPRFIDLSKRLLEDASNGTEISIGALTSAIGAINRDIERITRERRYMVLEALVGYAKRNPALAVGGMIAATLGVSDHLIGCGTATLVGAASEGAKRVLRIKGSEASKKLIRKVRSDLQPILDRVFAQYLGTSATVMHVHTLRKEIQDASIRKKTGAATIDATPNE
jgi:hypothetical protein